MRRKFIFQKKFNRRNLWLLHYSLDIIDGIIEGHNIYSSMYSCRGGNLQGLVGTLDSQFIILTGF